MYFNRMLQRNMTSEGWITGKHIFVGETRIATKQHLEKNVTEDEDKRTYSYHGDHLGSAQVVTDYRGEVYEHIEYTPYGELWLEQGGLTDRTAYRFTGKELDKETGLYYYGARYLNPQTGMWLSADPAMGDYIPRAPIDDEAKKHNENLPGMGGVYNYVNLHVYHYAGNNPVKLTDPDGRSPWDSVFGFSFDPIGDFFNLLGQFDLSIKAGTIFQAAGNGDKSAQAYLGYLWHEAGRGVLKEISDKSTTASLAFLAIGVPEAAGIAGTIGTIADAGLALDDFLSGNYADGLSGAITIAAGYGISKAVKGVLDTAVDKGIKISVGKNGQYYSADRRGALGKWDAMQTLIKADIASGKFGEIAPEAANQLVNLAKKAYDALFNE
jgi:RHS repeat-associated protein